ncbi:helix-turn-helix domain-containing protein [Paracidovorax avenae]|uniref:helix-turn-helix domain-containing protein n=1 Tax=Paracidovorax avenae TaxID=80867 RepID=UPI001F1E5CF2|nr:helix-turn-helix domain-containing protein [Paracidovorax avenae]
MTLEELSDLIERASAAAGSQRKLAAMLDTTGPTLIQMKQGKRPANWRVRGKLRAILGEDPAHAFMAAMAEDLASSGNEDEKKAADGFEAMLAAFPDWRKRMFSLLRSVAYALQSPLDHRCGYAVLVS